MQKKLEKIVGFGINNLKPEITLYQRDGQQTKEIKNEFFPFLIADEKIEQYLDDKIKSELISISHLELPDEIKRKKDEFYTALLVFKNPASLNDSYKWLREKAPDFLDRAYDVITQYQFVTGQKMYQNMSFAELKRLQLDILHYDSQKFRIVCKADNYTYPITKNRFQDLAEIFFAFVQDKNPDVIEVYNLEQTLGVLAEEADAFEMPLMLGRDANSQSQARYTGRNAASSRFHIRRHLPKIDINGREAIDVYLAAYRFNKDMQAFKRLNLINFRDYFDIDKKLPFVNVLDFISKYTMQSSFLITQIAPLRLQGTYRIGIANIIDHMLLEAYLSRGMAVPKPRAYSPIKGGLTEIYFKGIENDVHKMDVKEMYPSITETYGLFLSKAYLLSD